MLSPATYRWLVRFEMRSKCCWQGSHGKYSNFKPTCHHFDLPFPGPFPFQSMSARAMSSALFVMVNTANVQVLLKVEGPMFYFSLFLMSKLDVNGWFIVFCTFSFAESHYCLCQTENRAVGWWPLLACWGARFGISAVTASISLTLVRGAVTRFKDKTLNSFSVSNKSLYFDIRNHGACVFNCVLISTEVFVLVCNHSHNKCHQQNVFKYFGNVI